MSLEFSDAPIVVVQQAQIKQTHEIVLDNLNFEIKKGEFVYLIGKTGSGKSSFLKTLYADLPLHKGSIRIADFELFKLNSSKIPLLRRKIGIIFQDFQLLTDRTVGENLTFVLKATGWTDKTKMRNKVNDALMMVGLSSSIHKYPHQLSGGEQQRVVIARAILNEPHVLIADEPTGNLDPEVSDEILQIFKKINNAGTAILMATHDYSLITRFPFRVLKVENQGIVESNMHV